MARFRFRTLPRFVPGDEGGIWYRDASGNLVELPYPSGATLGDYVLVTGDDTHPVWMLADDLIATTAGPTPVTIDDGAGGFEIVFDEDGNVVYA